MIALRAVAGLILVVAACAGHTPTASQSAPAASPGDTVAPTPAGGQVAPPYGLAANGPIVYGEDGDIYSLDLGTGTRSLLIGGPELDVGPSYSRDGTRLSFVRVTGQDPETIALMIADADGSNVRVALEPEPVGERHWFEWSPDSDALVVANSGEGVPPLSIVDIDGEPERRAVNVAAEVNVVDWRPRSDELIFVGRLPEASGGRGLFAVGLDGRGLRTIVPAPTSGTHTALFSFSPDGRMLAYTYVNAGGHVSSHMLDLDSGETRTLGGSSNQAWVTFSPDGERLALIRYALSGATAQAFVGAAGGDGTDASAMGPEVRNEPGHHGLRIQFSPDGTKLLIVHAAGGGGWIADVATGAYESVAIGDDEWVGWRRLAP